MGVDSLPRKYYNCDKLDSFLPFWGYMNIYVWDNLICMSRAMWHVLRHTCLSHSWYVHVLFINIMLKTSLGDILISIIPPLVICTNMYSYWHRLLFNYCVTTPCFGHVFRPVDHRAYHPLWFTVLKGVYMYSKVYT